jgi:hypothetical protein
MARIAQICGAIAVIVALAIYVYFVVLQRASGYETAFAATFYAVLLGTLGFISAIGATFVLRLSAGVWARAESLVAWGG